MTKEMTIEEMKEAIAQAEAKARVTADQMKAARDSLRDQADKAHKEYIEFCITNNIPVKGKRAKA